MPDIITLTDSQKFWVLTLTIFLRISNLQQSKLHPMNHWLSNRLNCHPESIKNKLSWDMSRGTGRIADFSGLKDLYEKFSSSNMKRCKFIGSDLSGLVLKYNNVDSCDFSGSNFSSSRIQNSNLSQQSV